MRLNSAMLKQVNFTRCIWIRCWCVLIRFAGNTTTYSRKPASHVRSTKLHSAFKWPHVFILSIKSCGPFPLHTILTKHQAFAASDPISFPSKFRFFKAEFCRRHSAKAWQEKADGRRVQLFWSNSGSSHSSLPSREFLQNQGMRDGWFWYTICFV